MKIINLSEIKVPEDRIRKDFNEEKLNVLAESISKNGLLHAPVVRNDGVTLIAGERRFRAIQILAKNDIPFSYADQEIPPGSIPVVPQSELSERALREIELDENIRRVNLTWQEEAAGIAAIHEFVSEDAIARGERPTFRRTVDKLLEDFGLEKSEGRALNHVSDSVHLAKYINDPEVSKAKDKKEALKIIEKRNAAEHRKRLAEEFNITRKFTKHKLLKGSLLDILPTFESDYFDCIISDPPYGINADQFRNQNAVKHIYKDDEEYSNSIIHCILEEGFRVCKSKAHLYMFCDIDRFFAIKQMAQDIGWYVWRTPLIWYKGDRFGLLPRPEHGPRRSYELILYMIKGDRKVISVMSDVVIIPHDTEVSRAAHKPADLYKTLIARSCNPGDNILDPSCGTGPIFPAAEDTQTIATGIEIEDDGHAWASKRLREIEEGEEE